MDKVQSWISSGAKNSENFFVDDEHAPVDGAVAIGVGGIFTFVVSLDPPHRVTVPSYSNSKSLAAFMKRVNAKPHAAIDVCLSAATAAYLEIADDLDEENADDSEEYNDVIDVLTDQAVDAEAGERQRMMTAAAAAAAKIRQQYDVGSTSSATVERLLKDLEAVNSTKHFGWKAGPDGRNLSLWKIELFEFDKKTPLYDDMEKYKQRTGRNCIELTMSFPSGYPHKPPFIRVIRPRFKMYTGRITVGGSICTQLLTDDGWNPIFDVEGIIETIRQQITDPEAGARLQHDMTTDYTESEAREAFKRATEYHRVNGW